MLLGIIIKPIKRIADERDFFTKIMTSWDRSPCGAREDRWTVGWFALQSAMGPVLPALYVALDGTSDF
jgi:hypothetical protein